MYCTYVEIVYIDITVEPFSFTKFVNNCIIITYINKTIFNSVTSCFLHYNIETFGKGVIWDLKQRPF